MSYKHVIIFKNDAVGDLVHSLKSINNIIQDKEVKKITIFLSKFSKKFYFLLNHSKVEVKILNYNLSILEKIKLFTFILLTKVDKVFILAPKNFYYFLPIFFFKTKFYGLCIDNIDGYKRPSNFLRKFLYRYVVNDRSAIFKRKSTSKIQDELTFKDSLTNERKEMSIKISEQLKKYLPKNYFYFHAKRKILNELGWGIDELKLIFEEFLKFSDNVVLTKDIETDKNTKAFKNDFNSFDLKTLKFIDRSKKVIFFDNIDGKDLYNVIFHSKKIVAFHGMMTNIGSINKQQVLDLFHCRIKNWNDYRNYRNSFYEFKPKYVGYDFIIPSKDIDKTIRKMRYSLKK